MIRLETIDSLLSILNQQFLSNHSNLSKLMQLLVYFEKDSSLSLSKYLLKFFNLLGFELLLHNNVDDLLTPRILQ